MGSPTEYKNSIYLEGLAWSLLLLLIIIPFLYYNQLPDQIPSHFNGRGNPDNYSNKASIFIMPGIGLVVFLLLHFLSNKENLQSSTYRKLSQEELEKARIQSRKVLNVFKIIIPTFFIYITYSTIQIALGEITGLGNYFLFVFMAVIFGTIAYYAMWNRSEYVFLHSYSR